MYADGDTGRHHIGLQQLDELKRRNGRYNGIVTRR
jgi:hypothetical protein